jgi:hypothetical protein
MVEPGRHPVLEELVREVQDLRQRLERLEQFVAAGPAPLVASPPPSPIPEAETPAALGTLESTAASLPVLGRALLGLAGAYLLRALTESGTLHPRAGVGAGILYALLWLVLAARAPAGAKFLIAIHGLTSALVIAPLLFEATVRLKVVNPAAAAAMLAFFSVFGLAISWRKNLAGVAWITTLAGLGTSLVLLITMKDLAPFTLGLLAIAAAVETAAFYDHWLGERWIVAISLDLCLLLLTFVAGRNGGLPENYVPFSPAIALSLLGVLLLVYLGGAVARTLVRGLEITGFETIQTICAFLIALWGSLRIAAGNPRAAIAVGLLALLAAGACYLVSYALVERRQMPRRNLYTYTTFAFLLVLTGSRLLFDEPALSLLGSALAVTCLWTGLRSGRRTLLLQAGAYLIVTSLASGAIAQAGLYLLHQPAMLPAPNPAALAATIAAAVGTGVLLLGRGGDETLVRRTAWVIFVGLAGWTGAGMLAWMLSSATGGIAARGPFSATLATILCCALSLALTWIGRRRGRGELVWLVPPLLALTAYKLVAEDLRNGQTWTLVVSLLAYGAALVLLPRFLQKSRSTS